MLTNPAQPYNEKRPKRKVLPMWPRALSPRRGEKKVVVVRFRARRTDDDNTPTSPAGAAVAA